MGEQSPSESAARDTSTVRGGRAAYAKATQQARTAEAKRKEREQEEAMMRMAEDEDQVGLYARSSSGNIIRSSSGAGVTSSAGRQAQENIRSGFALTKGVSRSSLPAVTSGGDDAYAPQAERPQDSIIDPIQTADLSRAARRVAGQGQVGRGQRRFIRTI